MTRASTARTAGALCALAVAASGCSSSVGTGDTAAATTPSAAPVADVTETQATETPATETQATETQPPVRPTVPAPDPAPTAPAVPATAPASGTSFADEVPMAATDGAAPYASYTTITDDTGRITVEVPAEWADVDGAPLQSGGVTISDVRASSDLAAFASTWTTPGVAVSAADLPGTTAAQVLDGERATFDGQCTFDSRNPYADPLYVGEFDIYRDCGGTGVTYVVVAAQLPDGTGPIIEVQVQVVGERDLDALDRIVDSFVVS